MTVGKQTSLTLSGPMASLTLAKELNDGVAVTLGATANVTTMTVDTPNPVAINGKVGTLKVTAAANITLANRILTTKDSDIGITVTLKNGGSGHILSDACYPYQAISFTQSDWESSKQQDVEIPSAREGYTKLFVRVAEVDEQRIIFTPEEGRTLYAEDAQLELCLDSVYADDVYIPYQLKQDDALVLEVNGRYALHEDGDDIADIAPISIIPKRYIEE